jgi:hypothetical protein
MSFDESYDTRRTDDFMIMNDLAQALKKDEGLKAQTQTGTARHVRHDASESALPARQFYRF